MYLKFVPQIFGVRWHQHITNSEILSHAGVGTAAFGHIARLADHVPARLASVVRSTHLLVVFPVAVGTVVLVAKETDG